MSVWIKFRPSSHSEDGTVVAVYDTEKKAIEMARKLERKLGCATCSSYGRKVKVRCGDCDYGTLEMATTILTQAGAKNVEELDSYQELTIQAILPTGITPETAMLVLDRDTGEVLKWLAELASKRTLMDEDEFSGDLARASMQQKKTKQGTLLTFTYAGPTIYMRPMNYNKTSAPNGEIWVHHRSCALPKIFKVTGLI